MTLDQIRAFVAVAEKEHLIRGAEALQLTQSMANAAITSLENEYGMRLFDRIGRRVRLNEPGRKFLNHAKTLLESAYAAEHALRNLSGSYKGAILIGASQTVASYWLPVRLVEFRSAFPDVEIIVKLGNTEQVVEWVVTGSVQLGLIEGHIEENSFIESIVGVDQLCLVVGRDHEWHGQCASKIDLLTGSWVLRERGSGTRSEFEAVLRARGIDARSLKVVLELPSNEAVREAVEAGCGATVLSELVVEQSLQLGNLQRVQIDLPKRAFRLVRHRERFESQAMAVFTSFLRRTNGVKRVS